MKADAFLKEFDKGKINIKELIESAHNVGIIQVSAEQDAETPDIVFVDTRFVLFIGEDEENGRI